MNTNRKTLTLLIHTNVAFEWCKSIVAQLNQQAIKRAFSLNIVYRYEDIVSSDEPVILLGVDRLWLTENLRRLEESGHKVILLSGVVEKISSNIEVVEIAKFPEVLSIKNVKKDNNLDNEINSYKVIKNISDFVGGSCSDGAVADFIDYLTEKLEN